MNAELLGTQATYLPCSANLGYEKQRLSIFQPLLRRNPPVSRNLRQPGFQLVATGQVIDRATQNISSSVFRWVHWRLCADRDPRVQQGF